MKMKTTCQNLTEYSKSSAEGTFIVTDAYIKKNQDLKSTTQLYSLRKYRKINPNPKLAEVGK